MEQAAQQAGIHRSTLYRWEQGQTQPRLPELEALLEALGASPTQRRQAIALVDAPRAQALVKVQNARIAARRGLGTMPQGGDLLRAMRLRRGRSLEEVAAHIGMTSWTLRRWEKAETWPSVEHLHALCYALGAKEEEVLALTCGHFSRLATTPRTTVQALEERVQQFTRTLYDPSFELKDLELLGMQAEAWALAAQSFAGVHLLAKVYASSYHYLAYHDRYAEAAAVAERYFDLLHEQTLDFRSQVSWQAIRLGAVTDRWKAGGRTTPKSCLEELKAILPLTRGNWNEPDALYRIADILLWQGAQDEALRVSEEAYQAAARNMGNVESEWFRGGMGILLIQSGRFAEGLPLLSTGRPGDWYRLVETSLWKAEAFLGLGKSTEAETWLARAQFDLTTYEMNSLQSRLDALKARL